MSPDEAAARRAITTYARKTLSTSRVLDLRFDKTRGAWVASAMGPEGAIEVTARPDGTTFALSHARQEHRGDAGAAVRSHAHVANESAMAFLLRGVVFAAIAAALGMGYLVGKPQIERLLQPAQGVKTTAPRPGSELGGAVGGTSPMLEKAEQLSRDPKAQDAMNRLIREQAGGAAGKLDTLQQLNSTGQ